MEKCVLDLGAGIRDAKERFGYERIVLGGWSGGGSLALFYQEQAERPSITATPAGDPVDLAGANLIAGDAVFLVAAHVSRAVTLTEWIDPSIVDESDPERRDPELYLYAAAQPEPAALHSRLRRALPRRAGRAQPSHHRLGRERLDRAARTRPAARRASASSSTAPWPIRAGSIRRSSRTAASPGSATSAIRAS